MATGYKVNGVDLNEIFAPILPERVPANAVGFKASGQDLSQIFEPITTAGQKIGSDTNFKKNGNDLRNVFCDINWSPTPTPTLTMTMTPTISATPAVTPSKSY